MFHHRIVAMSFAVLCALVSGHAEAVQRAHVSALVGLDSNTAFNCDVAHPCRFFQAATSVVDPNGEVVVLDSGGYGAVTLSQSISLTAPTGVYAGISVFPGATGVTIATAGVNVTLRGLTINGLGGDNGVLMTNGARLAIENCVITNFAVGFGILVDTAAKVRIVDTLLRDNFNGIVLQAGAVAHISRATVAGTTAFGIRAVGTIASKTSTAAISDSTVSGSYVGIQAFSDTANAAARVSVIRSNVTNGTFGISSDASVGTALLTLGESMVTGNLTGLSQFGAGAMLKSFGNNAVDQNDVAASGTITTATFR